MDVRVCGPNLRDQSQGTFHVHKDGCPDLRKYGPGKVFGGDLNGNREMLIKNASMFKVVTDVYADQIDEQPDDEVVDYLHFLVGDFYWAPCCSEGPYAIPYGEFPEKGDTYADSTPVPDERPELFEVVGEAVYDAETDTLTAVSYEQDVFECWVAEKRDTFRQVYTREELNAWLDEHFDSLGMHERISIVKHAVSEYTS
jgi:hypothetical protein